MMCSSESSLPGQFPFISPSLPSLPIVYPIGREAGKLEFGVVYQFTGRSLPA
jgi:hypothetical protein